MDSNQELRVQTKDPLWEATLAARDGAPKGEDRVVNPHLASDIATNQTTHDDGAFIPMEAKEDSLSPYPVHLRRRVFEGSRPGYVFKWGQHGLGYYHDPGDRRSYGPDKAFFTTEETSLAVKVENQKPIYSLEEIMKFNNNIQMRDELINSLKHSEKKNQRLTEFINFVADLLRPGDHEPYGDIFVSKDIIETEIYNLEKTHVI